MWQLTNETETERTYTNGHSEIKTLLIHTDEAGLKWWGFDNLLSVPYVRMAHSKLIEDLFQLGVSHADLKSWFQEIKDIAKSNDTEKYEKLYAFILKKEEIIETVSDPLKLYLGLSAVYVLSNEEDIDKFNYDIADEKLKKWNTRDQNYFLDWLFKKMQQYATAFDAISQLENLRTNGT